MNCKTPNCKNESSKYNPFFCDEHLLYGQNTPPKSREQMVKEVMEQARPVLRDLEKFDRGEPIQNGLQSKEIGWAETLRIVCANGLIHPELYDEIKLVFTEALATQKEGLKKGILKVNYDIHGYSPCRDTEKNKGIWCSECLTIDSVLALIEE